MTSVSRQGWGAWRLPGLRALRKLKHPSLDPPAKREANFTLNFTVTKEESNQFVSIIYISIMILYHSMFGTGR